MWLKIDLKAQLFEIGIDASTLWIAAQLLMLAGVLSSSNTIRMF